MRSTTACLPRSELSTPRRTDARSSSSSRRIQAPAWACSSVSPSSGRAAKLSAPGAIVIQFLGGIHEIYFPYVLSNPIMIVALWAGGLVADTIFVATNAGLVATPSPGSIFAYLAVTPPGQHFGVFLGVFA